MHLEVLIEDKSGTIAVDLLLEKILDSGKIACTWRTHAYKGIGRLPRNTQRSERRSHLLLNNLPRIMRGYGRSLTRNSAVLVVVDLDDRNCQSFKQDLLHVLHDCNPSPTALFRIAIEEIEAWLLGDAEAVKAAYPRAKWPVLNRYEPDSICGTWEVLADAVYPGGAAKLKNMGYPEVGRIKCEWAERITPHIELDRNRSKSFQVFRDGVLRLAEGWPE